MKSPRERVLVIDDFTDTAEALQYLLESWGYTVDVAHDAHAGYALATYQRPDAIIVDLGLPTVAEGCALVRRIRALPIGDLFLILAVTGHGEDSAYRQAIEAGCNFFFVKPADLDELSDALGAIASHRKDAFRARGH